MLLPMASADHAIAAVRIHCFTILLVGIVAIAALKVASSALRRVDGTLSNIFLSRLLAVGAANLD